jgi:SAM-dependent methyltransferase
MSGVHASPDDETLGRVLRVPPGQREVPPFNAGWDVGGRSASYLDYVTEPDVNWSDELEALHEESTRDHFIDVWTRRAVLDVLEPALRTAEVVADAGCSTGYLLEDLRAARRDALLIGLDLVAAGLRKAHASVPDAALLLADVTSLPLEDGTVHALASINVLEHVADDAGALREIARVLRPGALAAIVVPAGPGLYDYYDRMLGHERRYAAGELARKAHAGGLEVVLDTHLGWTLHPAFWAKKHFNRLRHPDPAPDEIERLVARDISSTEGSRLGRAATEIERRLLVRGVRPRFGIRNLVGLRRPP